MSKQSERACAGDGKMSVAVHTVGAQLGEPVILTGEAVIVAIEAGKLSWQDAIQRKLIVIVPGEGAPMLKLGKLKLEKGKR
jgi:hypothetical protein